MKRWFSYDPNGNGFEFHDSAEAAEKAADEAFDHERAEAGEGWSDEVEDICWGEVRERVVEVSRLEKPSGVTLDAYGIGSDGVDYSETTGGCDALVDYELRAPDEGGAP